ncbi:Ger(x)C family spore germination protein [Paenibacillus sp. PR3]|uniref:Ger(X)C family spore germination protein n=1 Tax=Paenibacillus terricola TaxID=2763503 RepID=A0ABR8N1F0_9BACL|nr:Ger(x)C family spore germination protein [Paenibacillus terricola]MBD3921978.1 Ger(x)C family spore germination protein [Paenibacillus terricola]
MGRTIMAIAVLIFLLCETGCSTDIKQIERLNFANAIGIDFQDGEYYIYVQLVSFQSVAKSEGPRQPAKTWVGKGNGKSFEDTFFRIYLTAQERIIWAHVTAIVFSENALKAGLAPVIDSINRYQEFRMTPWVFATRGDVREMLSVNGFYDKSPLSTILHAPIGTYSQSSNIEPMKLFTMVKDMTEPGNTTVIPVLKVNKETWTMTDHKTDPKYEIEGAIFMKNTAFRAYIPLKKLNGLRWMQRGTVRAAVSLPSPEQMLVEVIMESPKAKVTLVNRGGQPQYKIDVRATGYVMYRENNAYPELSELTSETEKVIKEEIRQLYDLGVRKKTDVLNLEHALYVKNNRLWKRAHPIEDYLSSEELLKTIDVHVSITHSNASKNKRVNFPE